MSDYSYSEIKNMQQRAMERVRQMRQNSDSVLETAQKDFGYPEKKVSDYNSKPVYPPIIKPKQTTMPPNFPKIYSNEETDEKKEEEVKEHNKPVRADKGTNVLPDILADPDDALLLGLLLLLRSENADESLMMALMYIIS